MASLRPVRRLDAVMIVIISPAWSGTFRDSATSRTTRETPMKATTVLSEFASKTGFDDISAEAVSATKRHILDCAGVALAATVEPAGASLWTLRGSREGNQRHPFSEPPCAPASCPPHGPMAPWRTCWISTTPVFHIQPPAFYRPRSPWRRNQARQVANWLPPSVLVWRCSNGCRLSGARIPSHFPLWVFGGGGGSRQYRRTEPPANGSGHRTCGG